MRDKGDCGWPSYVYRRGGIEANLLVGGGGGDFWARGREDRIFIKINGKSVRLFLLLIYNLFIFPYFRDTHPRCSTWLVNGGTRFFADLRDRMAHKWAESGSHCCQIRKFVMYPLLLHICSS